MSLLQSRTNHGQVLITYSPERISEMKPYREEKCVALASLIRNRMQLLGIKIQKLIQPTGEGRFADIIIEFTVDNEEEIERLKDAIRHIANESEGVGKVNLFINRK